MHSADIPSALFSCQAVPKSLSCMCKGARDNLKFMGMKIIVVVILLFYVHSKHLRSCRDGQLT